MRLPELAGSPALGTGAASHILGARSEQTASVSPQSWPSFPHITAQHSPLLLFLQMLSHDHLHQHPRSAQLRGRPSHSESPKAPAPRRTTAHRLQRPQTTGPKDLRGPESPGWGIFVISAQTRAHRATESAQPASPGPAGGQWFALQVCKLGAEPSLPYISAARAERPPGGRVAASPAASPGGSRLSFTAQAADGVCLPRPGRGGARAGERAGAGSREPGPGAGSRAPLQRPGRSAAARRGVGAGLPPEGRRLC